jgi:hypothetical protein
VIGREHMPLCPYCASTMRAGAAVEIVTAFGLLALMHVRCAAAERRERSKHEPLLVAREACKGAPEPAVRPP